jgi:hypothetical protein
MKYVILKWDGSSGSAIEEKYFSSIDRVQNYLGEKQSEDFSIYTAESQNHGVSFCVYPKENDSWDGVPYTPNDEEISEKLIAETIIIPEEPPPVEEPPAAIEEIIQEIETVKQNDPTTWQKFKSLLGIA